MVWTEEQVVKLDERQLQETVLVPLFRAMGFQDVRVHHGGSGESGKDITMWKPDPLENRVDYAVVVKAKPIRGKVTGSSGAAEVFTQVCQCFGTPYLDSVNAKERHVQQCIVVCSDRITKEALGALSGALQSQNLLRNTQFVDGTKLLEELERHLPACRAWQRLQEAQRILDDASPHYRIVPIPTADGIKVSVVPKHPNAEQTDPLRFSVVLSLPHTEDGREMFEAIQHSVKTGAPVTIPKEYIDSVRMPDFLVPFIDPGRRGPEQIQVTPLPPSEPLTVALTMETNGGVVSSYGGLDLYMLQAGTEEITLSNDKQPGVLRLRVVINRLTHSFRVDFQFDLTGTNPHQALRTLRFLDAMSEGGTLSIQQEDTGLSVGNAVLGPGAVRGADRRITELVSKLASIQEKARVPVGIPRRPITGADARTIFETAEKMATGHAVFHFSEWTFKGDKKLAHSLLGAFQSGNPLPVRFESEESVTILDTEVSLGRVIFNCEKAYISQQDLATLQTEVESMGDADPIEIRLRPFDNCPVVAQYPQWSSLP